MPTKKKSERSFKATAHYNEYMRARYAKKRQAEGKTYTPRSTRVEVPTPQEAIDVLKQQAERREA